ncbi:tetratricopeptide repeat protein [Rickettsiella endosymbiont of Dermanyssus gallinae]|uniref:tetratricopeptide repeat protein n=1 Tax=Rickettsiella endosymbiont of Dermanyssus gallinae TaxID=2856608 RepID=UPI001C52EDB5|nr:tetratricopeptide repeat protein [Rickettsiella endosymbiont of Dermanyssus gallinae]
MPNIQADGRKEEGNAFFKQSKFREALICYEKAIQIDREIAPFWFNKGLVLIQLERLDEALASIDEALKIDGRYLKAWLQKASILHNKKKYYEAAQCYQQVLTLDADQEEALKNYRTCIDREKAAIFYYVVDLKVNEQEQIKILEFGRGFQSGTSGYDELFGDRKNFPGIFLRRQLEQTLEKIINPVYFNSFPGAPWSQDDSEYASFLNSLEKSKHNDSRKLDFYSGIYSGVSVKASPEHVLTLDDDPVLQTILDDKILMHLSLPPQAKAYRPQALSFPRQYTPTLAQQICQTINSDYIVLKIADSQEGKGVITVRREKLDETLRFLLANDQSELIRLVLPTVANDRFFKLKKRDPLAARDFFSEKIENKLKEPYGISMLCYQTWLNSNNPLFLVESYETSKPIKKSDAYYDATMRVLFLIIKKEGRYSFQPIGAYWKLPELPMMKKDKKLSCKDHRLSQISATGKQVGLSLEVDPTILRKVYAHLNLILPIIFKAAQETNYIELITTHLLSAANNKEECDFFYQMKLANNVGSLGRYETAISILEAIQKKQPNHYRSYHELAIIYHSQENYKKAIELYTKSLKLDPTFAAAYRRRAQSWLVLNDTNKAQRDIEKALKLAPHDSQALTVVAQIKIASDEQASSSYHFKR